MKPLTLTCIFTLSLLLTGCPKRQTGPRLVYLPAPPVAAPTAAPEPQVMVIEEPAPPESAPASDEAFAEAEPQAQASTSRQIRRPKPTVVDAAAATESAAPAEVPPPLLEPLESDDQAAQRGRIENSQKEVQQRIGRLKRSALSESERKTLRDASNFLSQSGAALREGDLQRSDILAHKADLLVTALERNR